ncbi:putative short chain dehydrogenase [Echria macrotheca]|uniref:Short chain dehydrogenase n=1 Tax=Echria macrotheca TaxID=438768 RepID=A0AAJ0BH25_9PEZI|nr:putative short chain dehydrogenase [Echria macrotheca]
MATKSAAAASHDEYHRNSLFNMKGRVALVTGGGSGIGLMITQALAVNGAKVYIVGRTAEKLQKVVDTYGKDIEGEIIALTADVTKKDDVARLVKEIESREKCLCILVNNAGVSSASQSTESDSAAEMKANLFDSDKATLSDWTDTYAANVASIFFATTAFLPLLQASSERHKGWSGTVINTTSISGMVKSAQHHFSYNASKAAAIHLTRMLAAEIAENGHKIRVNSIAPGPFPSEMTADESDEFQKSHIPKEKYEDKYPGARPGRDVDMAQAVLMMAANQFINGQTLAVDGGYTLAAGL